MLRLVTVSLLAFGLGSCARSDSTSFSDETPRGAWFSVAAKGPQEHFLNRLASPEHQLVVTEAPLQGALTARYLEPKRGERLVVVELQRGAERTALRGEVARMDGFAVVSLPELADAHTWLGRHDLHAEAVADTETVAPVTANVELTGRELEADVPIFIDQQFLRQKLRELSGDLPVEVAGRNVTINERKSDTGRANARAFLKQEYEKLGFTVSEHRYGSGSRQGVNFVAEKQGADTSKYVLLTSHLDNVGNAGADDNGAGTISDLAIAQALKDVPLKYNLRVVAFDQEELGLLGSAAYAKALSENGTIGGLVGVFNLEMTGYDNDNDGGFHAIDCNENTSAQLTAFIDGVLSREPIALHKVAACTNRSDHAAFWRYNKPAIVVSQNFFGGDDNPCYHQSCDKVDKLNWSYMQKISTAVAKGLADLIAQ